MTQKQLFLNSAPQINPERGDRMHWWDKTQGRWWGNCKQRFFFCLAIVWKIRRLSLLRTHYNIMVKPRHCVTSFPSSKWHTEEVLEDLERGCQDDEIFRMTPLQDMQWHEGCKDITMKTAWTEKTIANQIISPPQPQGWVFFTFIISHHPGKEKGGESPAMGKLEMTIWKTLTPGINIGVPRLRFDFVFLCCFFPVFSP